MKYDYLTKRWEKSELVDILVDLKYEFGIDTSLRIGAVEETDDIYYHLTIYSEDKNHLISDTTKDALVSRLLTMLNQEEMLVRSSFG